MKFFALAFVTLSLAACGTAKTVVLEAPKARKTYSSVDIVSNNPTVDVPADVTRVFEGELRNELFGEGPFSAGEQLRLLYTFVSHEEGNRLARWFWGGIGNSGEASVTIMVVYTNNGGEELAKTQVEGRIDSGFLGGSVDTAIKKAAQDVAEYTIKNFR